MLSFKKSRPALTQDQALTLQAADGNPLYTLPSDVVDNCRRMVTDLTIRNMWPNRLAVVSTLQGEGVTTMSLALGMVLANDLGANVCVVELNWWTPGLYSRLTKVFHPEDHAKRGRRAKNAPPVVPTLPSNFPENHGLGAVLLQHTDLESAIMPTAWPNLELIPAGVVPHERRPVVARSAELKATLDTLNQRYDYLLLDIPAIMATSDAVALASLADSCCLVVRQGTTSINHARSALHSISHLPVLGVVFNQVKISTPNWILSLIPQE